MGQLHSSGKYFHTVVVNDHFLTIQNLWTADDLASLVNRLKEMSLNFSLDKVKFSKLLQLASSYDAVVAQWFQEFSKDRASQVVDGLEFLSAAVLISSQLALYQKICILFDLFDLDKTGCVRKDEFTIFLKATTTGLHRMLTGLPPPSPVSELGGLSAEFFATLSSQALSKQDLLQWITEAHFSLNYLSVISKLDVCLFAWGGNQRRPLGLNMEPKQQLLPTPLLNLEGVRIQQIATHESHTLFLTQEGLLWSCGSGFAGILGHGDMKNRPQPQLIEALAHTAVVSIAVGVRHSVAVSSKGQVFTWGSADLGQLGHGDVTDAAVHEQAFDEKTGGSFSYVCKPTVVMGLFGKKIIAVQAACANFTTAILTDQGAVYSFGNNTDGQCGVGQRYAKQKLLYVEPHMHRTAMMVVMDPAKIELSSSSTKFSQICGGGYHFMAIESASPDRGGKLWTWGRGLYGKLGQGDQRSMYEPRAVDDLQHQVCEDIAAGSMHSICLCALSRLTITGSKPEDPRVAMLNPFSLLALPLARADLLADACVEVTPPDTSLKLKAYASAPLLYMSLPLRYDSDRPLGNMDGLSMDEVSRSVVLIDRGLWEGQWLKLNTTDFDFKVKLSSHGAQITPKTALIDHIMMPLEGKWDYALDCSGKICVFELSPRCEEPAPEKLTPIILEMAAACVKARAVACLCVLPKNAQLFDVPAPQNGASANLNGLPYGVMSYDHGIGLKKHLQRLVGVRAAEAPDGTLKETRDWQEKIEDFTGRTFYENTKTSEKRWTMPQVDSKTQATLMVVQEDTFLKRLKAVLTLRPKAIVLSQQSWRPDVEFVPIPEEIFGGGPPVPIVMVTYEAGEELKGVITSGAGPHMSMEVHPKGGVFAWGNGTAGQLGLAGIENQTFLEKSMNTLTREEFSFSSRPCYVAHLHEHQVTEVGCGSQHTVAVTQEGEVLAWGNRDSIGVVLDKQQQFSDVPVFVEQFEGLAKASRVFAGHNQSFALAEMPYKHVV
mmetsp:Transcript_16041/g.37833  ORF Transcript_16041/g.37833 Transcript_16041/m.37833 type:complete len:999 (-) Transcript_16041:9-3005(-)